MIRPRVLNCWMFIHSASRVPGSEGQRGSFPVETSQLGSSTKTQLSTLTVPSEEMSPSKEQQLRQPLGGVEWWGNQLVALWRSLNFVLVLLEGVGEGLAPEEGQLWPVTALEFPWLVWHSI